MSATVSMFEKDGKQFPMISLQRDDVKPRKDGTMPYPFSFGIGKAKLILAHIGQIKKFVEVNEKTSND